MNLALDKIPHYKNKLCIANFLFCVAYLIVRYPESELTVKSIAGLVIATLGPIVWDEWLYNEILQASVKKPLISWRTFLWFGFSFAAAISIALAYGLLRGTL